MGVLESLREGETFDWVDSVSIEMAKLILANGGPTGKLGARGHLGNMLLLIVGGTDTVRNTM